MPEPVSLNPSPNATAARALRGLRNVRGWPTLATRLAGAQGRFRVDNDGLWFEGDLASYVERQVYLFGGYEREQIDLFVASVPARANRAVLDIGANIGTHALAFSTAFETVLAFEPNREVLPSLHRNVALNAACRVAVHEIGLGDTAQTLDFFATGNSNAGLGTFSEVDQYDSPLRKLGSARIEVGDDYPPIQMLARIDAIKIDVQGLEPAVLRGLRRTLAKHRPVIWVEIGGGTLHSTATMAEFADLIPYPAEFFRFVGRRVGLRNSVALADMTGKTLTGGDYLIRPKG